MRKPLLALGLVVSTGLGAFPVADTLAAAPPGSTLVGSPPNFSPQATSANSSSSSKSQSVSGAQIVATAMKYLGYEYTATGNSPSTGFSCIGFASYVYRQNGINLPGDLQGAWNFAPQISFSQLQPGDLMYFKNTVWPGLSHVAIYIGGGKMIHAEYYGRGVTITSFYNDSVDGNYWPSHYMGANRPWTGASVSPVVPGSSTTTSPTTQSPTTTKSPVSTQVPAGATTAVVSASSGLNVRSGPSKSSTVAAVAASGSTVYVLGKSGNWYHVQLPNGVTGWVLGTYIGMGSSGSSTEQSNRPVTPARAGQPVSLGVQNTVASRVTALNVHSSPSTSGAVIGSLSKGQKVVVLGHSNGWVKVQLPDGSVGWVLASYTKGHASSSAAGSSSVKSSTTRSSTVKASSTKKTTSGIAVNVRRSPSLNAAVVAVVSSGGSYTILGWSHNWAHVRLSNGTTGWISGTVIGSTKTPSYSSYSSSGSRKSAASRTSSVSRAQYPHVVTAGVRVHATPSLRGRVVGGATAGTRARVLGYSNGFAHVQLSNGVTGYVFGSYVR